MQVAASIVDLDIAAPEAGDIQRSRTYVRSAGSMKLVVELRDATSGAIVGRIIDYYQAPEFMEPQRATQVSNADEFRLGFEEAARYTHEAISVAKAEKREEQERIKPEK